MTTWGAVRTGGGGGIPNQATGSHCCRFVCDGFQEACIEAFKSFGRAQAMQTQTTQPHVQRE